MKYCWASNCKETARKKTEVSFHLFPNDPNLRELWIKATGRLKKPGKTAVLCSKHFKDTDFQNTLRRIRLKIDAIPSQFENISEEQPEDSAGHAASTTELLAPIEHIYVKMEDIEKDSDNINNVQPVSPDPISVVSHPPKRYIWRPKHLKQVKPEHLSSPSQRDKYWSEAMQQITMLQKKVKSLQQQKRQLLKRSKNYKSMMDHLKKYYQKNALATTT